MYYSLAYKLLTFTETTFYIKENGIIDEVISEVKTKAHAAQILK